MRHAFTIIELTVTICILTVLSAIAIPRVGGFLDKIRVQSAVAEIESLFSTARHIAIARSSEATVDIDTISGVIYVSVAGDTLRKRGVAAAHDVELAANRTQMSYTATGMGYGAANLSVVVRRNAFADTVFVSRLGRVRH